jgi:hypothetical protein
VASPEKREGKLTGFWYGEVDRRNKGGQRFRRRFETKREAEGYEAYVKAAGCESGMPSSPGLPSRPPWLLCAPRRRARGSATSRGRAGSIGS